MFNYTILKTKNYCIFYIENVIIIIEISLMEIVMKTINTVFEDVNAEYDIELLAPVENVLFLDIETTGLTARNTNLYMIGCLYYKDNNWNAIQWFAENYEEELQVLTAFFDFAKNYNFLIHYNGNNFDIPYLLQKCQQFGLDNNFDSFSGVDIYKRIFACRDILPLTDLKQKTIEDFLEIKRDDTYTGRELISKYHDYVCEKKENDLNDLLLHNEDDLKGMLKIISMLAYNDIFNRSVRVMKAQANYYNDSDKKRKQEIILKVKLASSLPKAVSFKSLSCYFSGEDNHASLRIPLYDEELKYFYSNYQNYYYLPAEDIAMHKSVANFVDKAHRIQATASNCYTRKKSLFLPQWELLFTPFFKKDYKSKDMYFELTDEFKKSRSGFSMYAEHILSTMYRKGIE